MRSICLAFCCCAAISCAALAQEKAKAQARPDETKSKSAATPGRAEQLKNLRETYDTEAAKLQEEIDEAEAKLADLLDKQAGQAEEQISKLIELIKAAPKDAVALETIEYLLGDQLDYLDEEQATTIFETLAQHHATSDEIAPLCALTAELELSDAMRAFLAAVVAKNKNAEARAWAQFALATAKYTEADAANDLKLFKEAELLFDKVVKEIPAESTEGTPVDAAQRYLFELRNLLPGMKAPDFESEDLSGKRVKLSQQRGKVTLLVFWATWCEYCAELRPQQIELQRKHSGKPFAIVDVSGDDEVETVEEHVKEHSMPWAHWFNGPEGGVLDTWNVQAFPAIYVIDAAGVIRYRNIQGDELNKAVETLVKEAEQSAKEQSAEQPEKASGGK